MSIYGGSTIVIPVLTAKGLLVAADRLVCSRRIGEDLCVNAHLCEDKVEKIPSAHSSRALAITGAARSENYDWHAIVKAYLLEHRESTLDNNLMNALKAHLTSQTGQFKANNIQVPRFHVILMDYSAKEGRADYLCVYEGDQSPNTTEHTFDLCESQYLNDDAAVNKVYGDTTSFYTVRNSNQEAFTDLLGFVIGDPRPKFADLSGEIVEERMRAVIQLLIDAPKDRQDTCFEGIQVLLLDGKLAPV